MTTSTPQRSIVVGASSGIGRATAELLALCDHEVLAIGRDPRKLAELEGGAAHRGFGARLSVRAADAADPDEIRAAFEGFGPFDHLVLSPSSSRGMGTIATLDLADLRAGFEGKFWPHVVALQAALPSLDAVGTITLITAGSSGAAFPGTAGLAAINGALDAMVPVLAVELAPRRVNAVSPGIVDTPWWAGLAPQARDAVFAQYAAKAPAGRVGRAGDIADAVRFLLHNTFTTGAVLKVDGGARFTP
jgi:NAD(P)-dependent dehydrogenase (short-subunit alcohol dehydrogenase family)